MVHLNYYSTQNISEKLLKEIKEALKDLDFGSIEIFVTNGEVTQITRRHIKKTNNLPAVRQGLTKQKTSSKVL